MGNTIIRASHVGTVQRQVPKYNGPPTEEDIAIAKRAAETTRKTWAERDKQDREKAIAKLAKRKKAQEQKSAAKASRAAAKAKKLSSSLPEKKCIKSDQKDANERISVQLKQSNASAPVTSTPARKLGITDAEFDRRLAALRKFRSDNETLAPTVFELKK